MNDITCTVIRDEKVWQSDLQGLRPLMNWLDNEPEVLKGSYVIDKVVGKASALLLVYGKAAKVHGKTMSKAADEVLTRYGIEHSWDRMVDYIENNTRTDMCPMEKKVVSIDDPVLAYETFHSFFQQKRLEAKQAV